MMKDTRAPHPFKGVPGIAGCIEGLSREHAGISCGKPSSDSIHSVPLRGER